MKLIILIYGATIETIVMEEIEKAGIRAYTKLPRIQGVGTHSNPRLDSHIWPGVNNGLLILVDEARKEILLQRIRELKNSYSREGLKLFVIPVEEVV